MNKEKCECGKNAVWFYMPGFIDGGNPFYCDDCVHRGCSCNDLPIEGDNNTHHRVDEKGREYPCCEYGYSKEGFEKD